MSRCTSEGKRVVKFANMSNRGRVCLVYQNETTIMQNEFKFRQDLLFAVRTFTVATASQEATMINSTHNLPLLSLR